MSLPLIPPMLATSGALPPTAQDAQWAYETKQDGQRVVAYLAGDGNVVLRARSGEVVTVAYPELLPLGRALGPTPAVLDGEVLALDDKGAPTSSCCSPAWAWCSHPAGRRAERRRCPCISSCST
ncbi:DNA ligase [Streptomyces alboniger]